MIEFVSTAWDVIWYGIKFILAWIFVISLCIGLILFIIRGIAGREINDIFKKK